MGLALEPSIAIAAMVLTQLHHVSNKNRKPDTLEEDVAFIKRAFEMTRPFLMDVADQQRGGRHRQMMTMTASSSWSFRDWSRSLRKLAHNAEDCLLEFFLHLEKPSRASSPKMLLPRDVIAKKMRRLRNEIDQVNQSCALYSAAIYRLDVGAGQSSQLNPGPKIAPSRNAPLIGREKEKSDLVQLISQDCQCQQHQVISIWGMVGIGKTALVRSVYGSQQISSMFEQHAWVTISHPLNLQDVLTRLAQELDAQNVSVLGNDIQTYFETLEARIKASSRSCLIVLDDVFSIEEWNLIQPYLPETNTRVIVITREASIAEHCVTTYKNICKLEYLKDNEALTLFKKKVFDDGSTIDLNPDMTTQAKLIIKECDGHPLALTSIASFLAKKPKTAMEWKKLNDDFSAGSGSNPSNEMISTALAPSYDDLPYHLKLCLLYLSVFPKGHNIRRKRLVRRWVVEGYTSNTQNMSAEEVGESYFAEFISRSIIRPSETATHSVSSIAYCQVHNLIHHMSVMRSMEENHGFVLGFSSNNQDTIRHLSIISKSNIDKEMLASTDLSHVRSVTVFGEWTLDLDFGKMRLLRVLDLEGTSGFKDHDLKKIGNLLLLKYLSLRGCADIYHLPDELGNLWDLQVLDVSGTSIIKLPKTITKLKKLQYLRAGNVPKDGVASSSELKESSDLSKMLQVAIDDVELPEMVDKTVQVSKTAVDMTAAYCEKIFQNTDNVKKHDIYNKYCKVLIPSIVWGLDMHGVEVPDGIGQFKDLHMLGVINVASGKAIIGELEKLTKLHKLGLTGINKKNSQAVLSAIANLVLLHSLSLREEGKPGLHDCLDHKFSPPSKLQSLKIYGNLVTLPTWITQVQSLTKLKLRSTQLDLALSMEILGKLPHLSILRLWRNSFQGEKLIFHFQQGIFPSLVVLELSDLDGLKSLNFMLGALPKLELLHVDNCMHVDINGFSGTSYLPRLKEILLRGDYSDKFMENLRAQLTLSQNRPILKRA